MSTDKYKLESDNDSQINNIVGYKNPSSDIKLFDQTRYREGRKSDSDETLINGNGEVWHLSSELTCFVGFFFVTLTCFQFTAQGLWITLAHMRK